MIKVITYGTYDCLHYGHIRILERAKALGDYLIVGVTSEDFDNIRGKINVKQSLTERMASVRATGIADEIIVEEYPGQKIDDIQKYGIDIFTVGSDWVGQFDYLNEYCQVVYLPRTEGVSSSDLRSKENKLRYGVIGEAKPVLEKVITEGGYVNGLEYIGAYADDLKRLSENIKSSGRVFDNIEEFFLNVDAVYIASKPQFNYDYIKKALINRKHVICESPLAVSTAECIELYDLAKKNECVLMEAIKTAYSLAFNRMLLLIKSGIIGDVVSVDATCTSLSNNIEQVDDKIINNGSMYAWAPAALLAVFKILGTQYEGKTIETMMLKDDFDLFSKISFHYKCSVATIKVGKGVKSEGDLIVSGTKGYIYVPSPWWKTNYFEARFENPNDNQRFFYQLKGEGIRNMIVSFVKEIHLQNNSKISEDITLAIAHIMEDFRNGIDVRIIG